MTFWALNRNRQDALLGVIQGNGKRSSLAQKFCHDSGIKQIRRLEFARTVAKSVVRSTDYFWSDVNGKISGVRARVFGFRNRYSGNSLRS